MFTRACMHARVRVCDDRALIPTQLKATELVVALAAWTTQRSDPDWRARWGARAV
jgi:hypothetical protein